LFSFRSLSDYLLFVCCILILVVSLSYCPAAHHVLSTHKHEEGEEHALPQRLSLLLPTDVFNGTMEAFRAGGAPMVEVSEI